APTDPPVEEGPAGGFSMDDEYDEGYSEPNLERPMNAPTVQLPTPGVYAQPAEVTLFVNKQPVLQHAIETDETLIGRQDVRSDVYPDIDLSAYDPEGFISRKHAYIYRQNKNYTLYAVSNGGVQVNTTLLELGDREALRDGDVIVLAGFLAFKFRLPEH
ncbi:MAG: FHA domain-containing protein, partial [Myxococcota bacterium]